MKKYFLYLLCFFVLFSTTEVIGQPNLGERKRFFRNKDDSTESLQESFRRNRERIEMVRMWKLTRELNLDEKKAAKLFPLLNRYDQKRWDLGREYKKLLFDLRDALKEEKSDEKKVAEIVANIESHFVTQENLRKEELKDLKEILSIQELGKYLIFQEQFLSDIRKILWNIKKRPCYRFGMNQPRRTE